MEEDPSPDDTFATAARQQAAEHHEPEPAPSPEMLESLKAHDATDAHLPADERDREHGQSPAAP